MSPLGLTCLFCSLWLLCASSGWWGPREMSSWEVRAQSAASLLQDILGIREEMPGSLRKSKTERGFSRLKPQGSPQGSGLCYACTCWSSQGSCTMSRWRLLALPYFVPSFCLWKTSVSLPPLLPMAHPSHSPGRQTRPPSLAITTVYSILLSPRTKSMLVTSTKTSTQNSASWRQRLTAISADWKSSWKQLQKHWVKNLPKTPLCPDMVSSSGSGLWLSNSWWFGHRVIWAWVKGEELLFYFLDIYFHAENSQQVIGPQGRQAPWGGNLFPCSWWQTLCWLLWREITSSTIFS